MKSELWVKDRLAAEKFSYRVQKHHNNEEQILVCENTIKLLCEILEYSPEQIEKELEVIYGKR